MGVGPLVILMCFGLVYAILLSSLAWRLLNRGVHELVDKRAGDMEGLGSQTTSYKEQVSGTHA